MTGPSQPEPFPGRDSLEETQEADDSRLVGSWASSKSQGDGRQIGPYVVIRELGRGSFGAVFLAHKVGEGPVALKLLLDQGVADEEARARFQREAELAARVRHPGIVPLFEAGVDPQGLYYAMEYVPGGTLKQVFQQRGRLLPEEACELVANLADALEEAHRQGVVHRDVKPANVILEAKTGRPRLTDFGLARDTWQQSDLTRTRDVLGTPTHMAPEQFSGAKVDARADVYALGVILYQALGGKLPFFAESVVELQQQVLRATPTPLRQLRPDLSPSLVAIVERAMAKDPAARIPSARLLADVLSRDPNRSSTLAQLPAPGGHPSRGLQRALAAALGVALGLPLYLLLSAPVPDPVLAPQPLPPLRSPAAGRAEVFELAARGLPYEALAWRLRELELPASEQTAARVELAFRRGRLHEAHGLAGAIPADDVSTPALESRLCAGLALTFLGDYPEATVALQPLTRSEEPHVADVALAWLCLADDYTFSPQDYAASVNLLDRVLSERPDHHLAQVCRAYFAIASTKLEGLPQLERLAEQAPDHWIVSHLRGRALRFDPSRAGEAVEHLRRAARLTEGNCEPTLGYLVQALLIDGQVQAARQELEWAQARYPKVGGLKALEVVLCELEGQPQEAEAALDELVRLVGMERTRLELFWLRTPPMGPALEAVIKRVEAR